MKERSVLFIDFGERGRLDLKTCFDTCIEHKNNYTSRGKTRVLENTAPNAPAEASANGLEDIKKAYLGKSSIAYSFFRF